MFRLGRVLAALAVLAAACSPSGSSSADALTRTVRVDHNFDEFAGSFLAYRKITAKVGEKVMWTFIVPTPSASTCPRTFPSSSPKRTGRSRSTRRRTRRTGAGRAPPRQNPEDPLAAIDADAVDREALTALSRGHRREEIGPR